MNDRILTERPSVLMDLDDTILDFHKAEKVAVSYTFRVLGLEPSDAVIERYSDINLRHWEMLEEGLLTREQVLVGRFRELFRELRFSAPPEQAKSIYEKQLAIGHYFMPGAEQMLQSLSGKYRLFICSNGTASVQAGRIASAGIGPLFEEIFISEDIGINKPDKGFFEGCFSRIPDFCRERTIIIGDSLSSDIRGGINAGIKTLWYNPGGKKTRDDIRPDYETDCLLNISDILDRCFARH